MDKTRRAFVIEAMTRSSRCQEVDDCWMAAWARYKLQRRSLVPLRRDYSLQDFAFMVDGAPEVAELAVDLHEDLIQRG